MIPRKIVSLACILLLILSIFAGCRQDTDPNVTFGTQQPISENYEYSKEGGFCLRPSMVDRWVEKDALKTTTDDGTFFCYTEDPAQADGFVYAQRTLLRFLRDKGTATLRMDFYATHYDDSFSESSEKAAYIALSDVKTWRQVLVTLQTLWGDYVEYGYVYALSNAIAAELGWQTDAVPTVKQADMDAFFIANPDAVQLLYPSFTTEYATEETVSCCKALSVQLFEKADWTTALSTSVGAQLQEYYAQVNSYAEKLGIPFARQTCGYAYYGQRIPLRIQTSYAIHYVDSGYTDRYRQYYGDYFSDYVSVYATAEVLDQEIRAAVTGLGLEEDAERIRVNWISEDSAEQKYSDNFKGEYIFATQTVNLRTMDLCLFEYAQYLENLLNPDVNNTWQVQAFCDLVASDTRYYWYGMTETISKSPVYIELVGMLSGSPDLSGRDFYNEVNDILCYINGFQLGSSGYNTIQSMERYLVDLYGRSTATDILLYPEKVETVTGKNWDTLADEWEQMIRAKYDGKPLPDSVK